MKIKITPKHRFKDVTFKDIKITEQNKNLISYIKHYKENIADKLENCENLILCGTVGTGKSMIAHAFKNEIKDLKVEDNILTGNWDNINNCWEEINKEREFLFHYNTCQKLIENIRNVKFNKEDSEYSEDFYKKQDLLVIDEIGVQFKTDGERVTLYELFNHRWENYKPTWIISNHELKSNLTKRDDLYSILGGRICDRLISGSSKYFYLQGASNRTSK